MLRRTNYHQHGQSTGPTPLLPVRFNDLVGVNDRPSQPEPAVRRPIASTDAPPLLTDDVHNSGFVSGLVDAKRGRRMQATRRTFLRSTVAAAAATTAASMGSLFGPARRVEAQTGVIGTYPRRILTYCPPYNSNDNCQPGCGSSPICTDCCGSDGFFKNDPANGYTLYAGGCGDGDIADGWLWRFNGVCGSCGTIEYRCSDGYVQTDTGPAPFICRTVTDCQPLPEGVTAGPDLPDAARDTNWRPAGALELVVDNGGSVTMTGWIADATGEPVSMRIVANNQIIHFGTAALSRPDIASAVRGAGANTGYAVSFPMEPGDYKLCVNALRGAISVTIGCVNLNVGSGQAIRGSGGTTTIPGQTAPTPTPAPTSDATPTPTPTPAPTVEPVELVLPPLGDPSEHGAHGSAQVIRRSATSTGFASGWAGDPDTTDAAFIEVLVDGVAAALTRSELPRPDVAAAFPKLGADTGFALSFELPATEALVTVDVVDPQDGQRQTLGSRMIGAVIEPADDGGADEAGPPTSSGSAAAVEDVVWGRIDDIVTESGETIVRGWAFSPNDHTSAVTLTAAAGGVTSQTETGLDHDGARTTYGIDHPCGFEVRLVLAPGEHVLTLAAETPSGAQPIAEQTIQVP